MIAESYERIHRSNLIGMGIVPLQYQEGESTESLGLTGKETFSIDIPHDLHTTQLMDVKVFINLLFLVVWGVIIYPGYLALEYLP